MIGLAGEKILLGCVSVVHKTGRGGAESLAKNSCKHEPISKERPTEAPLLACEWQPCEQAYSGAPNQPPNKKPRANCPGPFKVVIEDCLYSSMAVKLAAASAS